jgi:hypothetical protein
LPQQQVVLQGDLAGRQVAGDASIRVDPLQVLRPQRCGAEHRPPSLRQWVVTAAGRTGHRDCSCGLPIRQPHPSKEMNMGKYFLGWLLGVPAVVLLVLWFFFR